MSIGGTLLTLGSHGYSVRVHNPTGEQGIVQIWRGIHDGALAEYPLPTSLTENTIDIVLEAILSRACKDMSLH